MRTYARIDNGIVAELFQTPGSITGMFHPSLIWVDVTATGGVTVGWTYDGSSFAAPAAPSEPAKSSMVTPYDFIHRFTDNEQHTITTAAQTNAAVMLWLFKSLAVTVIDLTDPVVKAGLDALVSAELLTADRAAEILTP